MRPCPQACRDLARTSFVQVGGTAINATTGEILTEHTSGPTHTYQVKNG